MKRTIFSAVMLLAAATMLSGCIFTNWHDHDRGHGYGHDRGKRGGGGGSGRR